MKLSKSKYVCFKRCPKQLWLEVYQNDIESKQYQKNNGIEVGEVAKSYFGEYVDVSSYTKNDELNVDKMISKTKECLKNDVVNICEAAFSYNDLYCAVDILHKEDNGYSIYEVKSTKDIKKHYLIDVAYQKYVLDKLGINIVGVYILLINNDYVLNGSLELDKLFKKVDVLNDISEYYNEIENKYKDALNILNDKSEPSTEIGLQCFTITNDYEGRCPYWDYCTKKLAKPNIFDLYKLNDKKAYEHYKNNVISFDDIIMHDNNCNIKDKIIKSGNNGKIQKIQLETESSQTGIYKDISVINDFLNKLTYQLYFLDFETFSSIIPIFEGSKVNEVIPFQYSLHYIEKEDGKVEHLEFLGESGTDPRRKLAEKLCNDIPLDVCILAYHSSTEINIVKNLAKLFPDLCEHLKNIANNILDLEEPFLKGGYYNKHMNGSLSIKYVLPAMFVNDPELDYHNLDGIHNGIEAMDIFPKIQKMSKEEQENTRKNLLEYCKLDTYAMVKIYQELLKFKKDNII